MYYDLIINSSKLQLHILLFVSGALISITCFYIFILRIPLLTFQDFMSMPVLDDHFGG